MNTPTPEPLPPSKVSLHHDGWIVHLPNIGGAEIRVSPRQAIDHEPTDKECDEAQRLAWMIYRTLEPRLATKEDAMPDTPKPWAYDLWKHLSDEYGLTLLESEIHEILRLAAALNARADADTRRWLPIETAPKDGTVILTTDGADNTLTGWWQNDCWHTGWVSGGHRSDPETLSPTHWIPLPSPPNAAPERSNPAPGANASDTPAYRPLEVGEVIQEGDEFLLNEKWFEVQSTLSEKWHPSDHNPMRRPLVAKAQAETPTAEDRGTARALFERLRDCFGDDYNVLARIETFLTPILRELREARARLASLDVPTNLANLAERFNRQAVAERDEAKRELRESHAKLAETEATVARLTAERDECTSALKKLIQAVQLYQLTGVPELKTVDDVVKAMGTVASKLDSVVLRADLNTALAQLKEARAALENVLKSAFPNKRDHPGMFAAWEKANAFLASSTPPASQQEQV